MSGRALAVFLLKAGEQLGMDHMVFAGGGNPEVEGVDFARIPPHQIREDLLLALELRGIRQSVECGAVQLVLDGFAEGRWRLAAGQGSLIGPGNGRKKEE